MLDNEICGMVYRLIAGIEPKEDFPAIGLFRELLKEKHMLISGHTRRYLKTEHFFPGPVIDRARRSKWEEEGSLTLRQRAHQEVKKLLANYKPPGLPEDVKKELTKLMVREARHHGQNSLPQLPD